MLPRLCRLSLLLALGTVAGCSAAPSKPARALPGKDSCLFSLTVRDWEVLDDQTLIVHAPLKKDAYLIKLFAPITGLRFHESLAFEDGDHNGQLCSMGDALAVGGPMPQHVPIVAVRLLTPEEQKQLQASVGKSP